MRGRVYDKSKEDWVSDDLEKPPSEMNDQDVLAILKVAIHRAATQWTDVSATTDLPMLLLAWEVRAYRMVEEAQAAAAMAMAGRTIEKMEDIVKR